MFNYQKPTVQMLGRWQPWHDGHTALFKKALTITGQVCIMIRDVGETDNLFEINEVIQNIHAGLSQHGFKPGREYVVMAVPNIVDISYGCGVGYTFTEHDLGEEIHDISATKIRASLRDQGKL